VTDGAARTTDNRDEQIELYVLGLLDDGEAAAVEQLLRDDPTARQQARELRGALSTLALHIEPLTPPPGLKARILDAARAERSPQAVESSSGPILLAERRERRLSRLAPWAAAAVLALALAASLVWNVQLRSDLDERPEIATYAVAGSGAAEDVSGELVVSDVTGAVLRLDGLIPLEPDRAYQIWLIGDGDPIPNVTFVPDANGAANVAVSGEIDGYAVLAVTIEPLGGSLAPTTEPIITSDLTEAT
jgi:anti-sigma-K factor RskA